MCTCAKHPAVKMAMLESSPSSVRLKTLLAKAKCGSTLVFLLIKNGAVTDKKQVVCQICDCSIAHFGNTMNLLCHLHTNHPEEPSEVAPKKAVEKCE